jgi:hypothetical protein
LWSLQFVISVCLLSSLHCRYNIFI